MLPWLPGTRWLIACPAGCLFPARQPLAIGCHASGSEYIGVEKVHIPCGHRCRPLERLCYQSICPYVDCRISPIECLSDEACRIAGYREAHGECMVVSQVTRPGEAALPKESDGGLILAGYACCTIAAYTISAEDGRANDSHEISTPWHFIGVGVEHHQVPRTAAREIRGQKAGIGDEAVYHVTYASHNLDQGSSS
jgi:hypothetical protein